MSGKTYVGNSSGKAKSPNSIYVGNSSNKAAAVKAVYIGNSSNKAVKVWPSTHIPDPAFKEVEYILSNKPAQQIIDTGVITNTKHRVVLDLKVRTKNYSDTGNKRFTGATRYGVITIVSKTDHTTVYFALLYPDIQYANPEHSTIYSDVPLTVDTRYNIDLNNSGRFYVNDKLIATSVSTEESPFYNFCLFGFGAAGGYDTTQDYSIEMYNCKIYLRGEIIRDFYPCYRTVDGLAGMYDIVNKQFYYNEYNTKYPFYAGPDAG